MKCSELDQNHTKVKSQRMQSQLVFFQVFSNGFVLPSGNLSQFAIEHGHRNSGFTWIFQWNMVIFHSSVISLPEGNSHKIPLNHHFPMVFSGFSHGFPMVLDPPMPTTLRRPCAATSWGTTSMGSTRRAMTKIPCCGWRICCWRLVDDFNGFSCNCFP